MATNPDRDQKYPTMIIPRGTEIRVDSQGQLSIKTPGNLVIQNSGSYSEIESLTGSIRIEENVNVEAITVRAADACYIQGTLTAWKVEAKKIALEERARANIILQDTQDLELAKSARLVGNFASEKELFLLLARFGAQMKQLPMQFDVPPAGASTAMPRHSEAMTLPEPAAPPAPKSPPRADSPASASVVPHPTLQTAALRAMSQVVPPPLGASPVPPSVAPPRAEEVAEPLSFALVLLDRDIRRPSYEDASREALLEIIRLIKNRDAEPLRTRYRELFRRVLDPSEDARKAAGLVERWASA